MSADATAVIGAGASGLMAAFWAAGGGGRVVLLESTREGGRKIAMSGGGRCNILPSISAPELFVTDSSPNTLRNIVRSWPLEEQRRFFEEETGLRLSVEEGTGKVFPEGGGRRVREALLESVRRRGAEVRFGCRVGALVREVEAWRLITEGGPDLRAARVVLASGGASVPSTGSDGWGYEAARRLGHTVHPTYPALTPLTARPPVHAHLAGVSLDVTLEAPGGRKKAAVEGGFLFTHGGYSGPAVLNLSHLAVRSRMAGGARQELLVRWSPLGAAEWERLLLGHRGTVFGLVAKHLPKRLAETLCLEAGVDAEAGASQLRRGLRIELLEKLTRYPLPWTGDEGFEKAEATGGGVDLGEVSPRTLESRLHRGLFLCGELLDALGPIGGYNFQWAWATGRAAGLGARAAGEV